MLQPLEPACLVDIDRVRASLVAAGIDCLVVSSPRNVYYLSGYRPFDSLIEPEATTYAVVPADDRLQPCVLVSMSERYVMEDFPSTLERRWFYGTFFIEGGPEVEPVFESSISGLMTLLEGELDVGARIAIETHHAPAQFVENLRDAFPRVALADADPVLQSLRQQKSPEEMARLRFAARAVDEAITETFRTVGAGTSEMEIARSIYLRLVERSTDPTYCLVGSGARSALGIPYPTPRKLSRGDVVRIDVAASYGGYYADLGRSYVVGTPTRRARQAYAASIAGLEAGIAAVAAGRPATAVFDAAMNAVLGTGQTGLRRHHIGHGVGLQAHEWPFIRKSDDVLPQGAVLAVEVPYYIYGEGGFAPEDMVIVHADGVERLTKSPSQMEALPVGRRR